MGHHLQTTATATNRTSPHGAPLRVQSNRNKLYILALAATAAYRTSKSQDWGTTSWHITAFRRHLETKHRQRFVRRPIEAQSNGNRSYIFALGTTWKKQRKQIVQLSMGATKATATNRTPQHWSPTSTSNGNKSFIFDQSNSNNLYIWQSNSIKLYILALRRHHFETAATATNRTSEH